MGEIKTSAMFEISKSKICTVQIRTSVDAGWSIPGVIVLARCARGDWAATSITRTGGGARGICRTEEDSHRRHRLADHNRARAICPVRWREARTDDIRLRGYRHPKNVIAGVRGVRVPVVS